MKFNPTKSSSSTQDLSLSKNQLQKYLETGLAAVSIGQKCLVKYFGHVKNVELKSKSNYVSLADRECEDIILKFLKEKNPEVDFLGEETHFTKSSKKLRNKNQFAAATGFRWILDPLDGTTNFIHGLPLFCISLALEFKCEIVVGIIHVPQLSQTFTAIVGQGAYLNGQLNGQKLSVSKKTELKNAFVVSGFVNQSKNILAKQLKIFNKAVWQMDAVRRTGSAAYDLALVSQGVFDFYWEENIKPWDIAAGILLVKEAGGIVCDYSGKPVSVFTKQLIAGNPKLAKKFTKFTKTYAKFRD